VGRIKGNQIVAHPHDLKKEREKQSTKDLDWNNVELRVFSSDNGPVSGLFTTPQTEIQNLA